MKFSKTGAKVSALIALGFLLAACNGNNPFKGDSNPVKEYPSAQEGVKYDVNNRPVVEPPPDNTQLSCQQGASVTIDPNHGDGNLMSIFTEDEVGGFNVTVTNLNMGQTGAHPFTVTHDGPEGSTFEQVSKDNNQAVFKFTWKPGKSRGSRLVTKTLKVVYHFGGGDAQKFCGEVPTSIGLIVDKTSLDPQVSFVNLPASMPYGDQGIGFQIQIDDPASNMENAPDIKEIGFRNQGTTGRQQVLDASDAVKCDEAGQFVEGTKWIFNCSITPSQIKRIKANATTDTKASFFVIAESKRNKGKASIAQTANLVITPKAGE